MPLNIDIQQILLHMLNLAILLAAVYFLLYNPVKKFMDKRNSLFDERENKVTEAEKEAQALKKEYTDKLSVVEEEISALKTESEKSARIQAEKTVAEAEARANEIIKSAKEKARAEHDIIIDSAYDEITKLAEEEAKKVVFESTQQAYDHFLDAVENGESEL